MPMAGEKNGRDSASAGRGLSILAAVFLAGVASLAQAQPEWRSERGVSPSPTLANGVGIKVTPSSVNQATLEADLDLTMYTRFSSPYSTYPAGVPTSGFPALDYGDGATLSTTALGLDSTGGGPGGSNVYRSFTSFTHSYPSTGSYTVTAASFCTACGRSSYVIFPAGSPVPTEFTASYDLLPDTVVGNLAGRTTFGDTVQIGPSTSVRYAVTLYYAVTNTAEVVFQAAPEMVDTISPIGLAILGVLLLAIGFLVFRHS